jgi:hypothetical protein
VKLATLALAGALAVAAPAAAQQREMNRAVIERDQQSAEFAARLRGQDTRALENLHARQLREALVPLSPNPDIARQLLPYQRGIMAQERAREIAAAPQAAVAGGHVRFDSPVFARPPADVRAPLPLPGGPQPGVDPVAP